MENNISLLNNSENRVVYCCEDNLYDIFQTLLLQKKSKQQELADYIGWDKANVSRMVHGKIIPPLRIRLKVAEFFSVDSCLIWRNFKVKDFEQEANDYFESIGIKAGEGANG